MHSRADSHLLGKNRGLSLSPRHGTHTSHTEVLVFCWNSSLCLLANLYSNSLSDCSNSNEEMIAVCFLLTFLSSWMRAEGEAESPRLLSSPLHTCFVRYPLYSSFSKEETDVFSRGNFQNPLPEKRRHWNRGIVCSGSSRWWCNIGMDDIRWKKELVRINVIK